MNFALIIFFCPELHKFLQIDLVIIFELIADVLKYLDVFLCVENYFFGSNFTKFQKLICEN
ncbi:hypothetical protein ASE21_02345 [Flavobacterium sp. Root901]|nr:hypothetical protein ASE21_02345 [Flavobacterium sp. Root901]